MTLAGSAAGLRVVRVFPEILLTLLLISSICAVGLGIVAMEYMEDVQAREAAYMKYGVCIQIWGFLALCLLHFQYGGDIFLHLMPMFALMGAGVFMLGAVSVLKAMPKARVAFGVLVCGIQLCVVTFLAITACLVP
jgi:hypothetical protein